VRELEAESLLVIENLPPFHSFLPSEERRDRENERTFFSFPDRREEGESIFLLYIPFHPCILRGRERGRKKVFFSSRESICLVKRKEGRSFLRRCLPPPPSFSREKKARTLASFPSLSREKCHLGKEASPPFPSPIPSIATENIGVFSARKCRPPLLFFFSSFST